MNLDDDTFAEIERNERWLAGQLQPVPSDQVIAGVRDAVHLAIEEQRLLEGCSPTADGPPGDVVERVKAAVRAELARRQRAGRYRVFVAMSAAAAGILIVVGTWFYAYRSGSAVKAEPPAYALADRFEAAWDAIGADETLSDVAADLAWIEAQMGEGAGGGTPWPDEVELEYLEDRIDGLFGGADYPFETS